MRGIMGHIDSYVAAVFGDGYDPNKVVDAFTLEDNIDDPVCGECGESYLDCTCLERQIDNLRSAISEGRYDLTN